MNLSRTAVSSCGAAFSVWHSLLHLTQHFTALSAELTRSHSNPRSIPDSSCQIQCLIYMLIALCHSACEKSYRCGDHVPLKCLRCCRDTLGVMLGGWPLLGGLLQVSSICGLNEAQTASLPKCRLISLSFSRVAFWKLQDWPGVASEIKAFTQGPVSFEQLFSFKKWNLQVIFV